MPKWFYVLYNDYGVSAGLADESSSDSSDEDDDDDDDNDEVEDSEGGEESCPPGCDPSLYDKVLQHCMPQGMHVQTEPAERAHECTDIE